MKKSKSPAKRTSEINEETVEQQQCEMCGIESDQDSNVEEMAAPGNFFGGVFCEGCYLDLTNAIFDELGRILCLPKKQREEEMAIFEEYLKKINSVDREAFLAMFNDRFEVTYAKFKSSRSNSKLRKVK